MKRLQPIVDWYGFRIVPTYALINNVWTKRHDIASVRYRGHHIMTIPVKMYRPENENYKTIEGKVQPNYSEREMRFRNWNFIIKNTPYIKELEEKKMKNMELEYKAKFYEEGTKT